MDEFDGWRGRRVKKNSSFFFPSTIATVESRTGVVQCHHTTRKDKASSSKTESDRVGRCCVDLIGILVQVRGC